VNASEAAGLVGGPGELVAVDMPPGPHWLERLEPLWRSGATVLPIDHRLSPTERRTLLERARPSIVIGEDEDVTLFVGDPVDATIGLVMATSGTAGVPKLVELSRAALEAALDASSTVLSVTPRDPWISCLTPAHMGGMLVLLRAVVLGAHVEVHARFEPDRLVEAPAGASVSLVPPMLRRLVDARIDLSRFGTLLVGGDALDATLADEARALGGRVVVTYGLTETSGGVVYDGVPFPTMRVRISPTDDRIEVRGPTLMEGYRFDPGATGAAFTPDGWLRTGDVGSLGPDGRLAVHGRADDAIRTGGETVWPQEVERGLSEHPKVADVAVVGRPDPEWGRHVVAFIVPVDPADPPTLKELRDHTSERLARFKAPRELIVVERIPRTAGGKIRRGEL
jgi:O-succinylbenzoic acid--CoA ligase